MGSEFWVFVAGGLVIVAIYGAAHLRERHQRKNARPLVHSDVRTQAGHDEQARIREGGTGGNQMET